MKVSETGHSSVKPRCEVNKQMSLSSNSSCPPNIKQVNSSTIDFSGRKLIFEMIINNNNKKTLFPKIPFLHRISFFMHMYFNKERFAFVKHIPFMISLMSWVITDIESIASCKCEPNSKKCSFEMSDFQIILIFWPSLIYFLLIQFLSCLSLIVKGHLTPKRDKLMGRL